MFLDHSTTHCSHCKGNNLTANRLVKRQIVIVYNFLNDMKKVWWESTVSEVMLTKLSMPLKPKVADCDDKFPDKGQVAKIP